MKLLVVTNDGRITGAFDEAERIDYIDYSAELDDAIAAAIKAEGGELPNWLQ